MTEIAPMLLDRLPLLAREVITEYSDGSPESAEFLQNPDDPKLHEPRWHQYGVVTHCERAAQSYFGEVQQYLGQWGVAEAVSDYLREPIDNTPKAELLGMALLFHDIGKFAARKAVQKEGGTGFTFRDHERFSGEIVRGSMFDFLEADSGLTPLEREYVARCTELHYELGKLRRVAKNSPTGFTIGFTESRVFDRGAREIANTNPDFRPEIGLLFLADNLSKVDMRIQAESDVAVEAQTQATREALQAQGLSPKLVPVVLELPINMAVARKYLDLIF